MSKLQELINELCPEGVEYMKVGDVTFYEQPAKYIVKSTNYNDDFNIPVLTAGQSFILGYTNETDGIFEATKQEPIIIFDDFTGAFKWVDFPFKVKSSAMKLITSNEGVVLLRYLYHIMGVIGLTSTEHKRLWLSQYSEIKIPVPPLPVQEEIVRILDKMTGYVTELKAELTLQKEVFDYCKNKIFERIDKKYYVPLNTIAKQERGKNRGQIIKDAFSVTQKGIIRTTDYFGEKTKITSENTSNYYILKPGWFAYSPSRINVGSFNYLRVNYDVIISPLNKVFSVKKEKIIPEFLYQYMTTTVGFSNMLKYREGIEGTGRWHLEFDDMAKMSIPLLSIEKQSEIVDKLRKFDILCNDLSSGLPAEIEARQKQYEYYRDRLLSFKEISHDSI